jgi:hypothetical protein
MNLGLHRCAQPTMLCWKAQSPELLNECLQKCMQAAALMVIHIPELAAESMLAHLQYDINGAFQSPGGEDHVGFWFS